MATNPYLQTRLNFDNPDQSGTIPHQIQDRIEKAAKLDQEAIPVVTIKIPSIKHLLK